MAEPSANTKDPVIMLTRAQMRSIGVKKMSEVIHPAFKSRYLFTDPADGSPGQVVDTEYWGFGRSYKPGARPVTLVGPDGMTPIIVAFDKHTEAAEVADVAQEAYENALARFKSTGQVIDTAKHRELRGLPPAATFDTRVREHLDKAIREKKRTMVTGHHYDMNQKYVKGQAQASVPDLPWQGEA